MKTLGGFWKTKGQSGLVYLRASFKQGVTIEPGAVVAILPNKFKDKPNDPDYRMVLMEREDSKPVTEEPLS